MPSQPRSHRRAHTACLAACLATCFPWSQAQAQVPSVCTARLRAAVHLRPGPVPQRVGPELPEGTSVDILAVSGLHRHNRGWDSAPDAVLSHVRVRSTGAEGYAFVRPVEFGPECPILAATDVGDVAGRITRARPRRFAERGFFALANRPLRGGFDPQRDAVVARVDADGDGTRDAVLLLTDQGRNGAFVLRRHTAAGWAAADLVERLDHDHFGGGFEGVIPAGGATYFQTDHWAMGIAARFGCRGVGDVDDSEAWTDLLRLHPDGDVLTVAFQPVGAFGEPVHWVGEADGAVRVEGTVTHRTQRLVWDPARFALVPEGPAMPLFEGDVSRCRPE